MKVRCIRTDTRQFPIDQRGRDYFRTWFGKNTEPVFDEVEIGRTYVVHAVKVYAGYPFYYVPYRHRGHDFWRLVPSLCVEVIDDRLSKLWRFQVAAARGPAPRFPLITTMAIKEWVDEPLFFERLVDLQERELRIFTEAAAAMDAEYD